MKDLEERTKRKSEWIKEHILFPTRFRKFLDVIMEDLFFIQKQKGKLGYFKQVKWPSF